MSAAKKLFLVPSDIMHSLQRKQRLEDVEEPEKKVKYEIDEKMNNLLDTKNISDHDKSIIYNQLLQTFLKQHQDSNLQKSHTTDNSHHKNLQELITQQNIPDIGLPKETGAPKESTHQQNLPKSVQPNMEITNILRSTPKMYRRSTENLLEYLQNNHVSWRDDGSIKIRDRVFPGSNIIDIANHLARHRINRENPKGTSELVEYLKGLNAPNEIIGNKEVWLEQQRTPITPPPSTFKQTPRKRKSKRTAALQAADTVKGWLTYR